MSCVNELHAFKFGESVSRDANARGYEAASQKPTTVMAYLRHSLSHRRAPQRLNVDETDDMPILHQDSAMQLGDRVNRGRVSRHVRPCSRPECTGRSEEASEDRQLLPETTEPGGLQRLPRAEEQV